MVSMYLRIENGTLYILMQVNSTETGSVVSSMLASKARKPVSSAGIDIFFSL